MEGILSAVIPSSTTLIDTIKGVVSSSGSYELTVNNYSTQTIPYYVNGSNSNIDNLLASWYTQAKRPSITLEKITSDVNDYVMQLRKSDIKNLVGKYYLGIFDFFCFVLVTLRMIIKNSFKSNFVINNKKKL